MSVFSLVALLSLPFHQLTRQHIPQLPLSGSLFAFPSPSTHFALVYTPLHPDYLSLSYPLDRFEAFAFFFFFLLESMFGGPSGSRPCFGSNIETMRENNVFSQWYIRLLPASLDIVHQKV